MSLGQPKCKLEDLHGLTARALVAIAIRTARRTIRKYPPTISLKRHQNLFDKMNNGLAVAEEVVTGTECTLTFIRRLSFAIEWIGKVADDVRYGPNQLELETSQANPAQCAVYAVAAASHAATAGLGRQMGEHADSDNFFRHVLERTHEAIRWGTLDKEDLAIARRIAGGELTEIGPTMDIGDEGPFGPLD